ncbi:MAG: PIG-L family deacetylase [Acidobacteria bacterium]|nr:PIG-L family deacetylase [Acidobacteriota bacterium]
MHSALPLTTSAQVRPVNDYGALGIGRLLRKLNTTASVMMVGAHPDDEDSSLLAFLARGENARTSYLSLTRGDGGQNIIGPELFESLGVIRTEELLQARRLDGAEQYFARAFDYGFSKSLAEAKQKWDEKIVLCDVVRGIRGFRPMVVLSRFSGTPSDGHGQHQYAGYITPLAVKAAADPAQCTQSGTPWQVQKFYSGIGGTPSLRVNTGQFDTMLGRSYSEIAIEGRSQHRSQGEGRIEVRGERFSGLNLVDSKVAKVEKETSIFDGLDTTVTGLSAVAGNSFPGLAADLESIKRSAETALKEFRPVEIRAMSPALQTGLRSTRDARAKLSNSSEASSRAIDSILARKEAEFSAAIASSYGITLDALSDKETVVPGDDLLANINVYFPKDQTVSVKQISLKVPSGWNAAKTVAPTAANPGFAGRDVANQAEYYAVTVAKNAVITQPYWLIEPRDGDLFRWPQDDTQNLPFQPQLLSAQATFSVGGIEIVLEQPVQYRFADPSRGEIRREINVVPALSLSVDQRLIVIPQSEKPQTRTLAINVTSNSVKPISGVTALSVEKLPKWDIKQNSSGFMLKTKGENSTLSVHMSIPARTQLGTYYISPNASSGNVTAEQTMTTIAYPHIQTHRYYTRAETKVEVLDLKVSPVKVGYIMGSGDEVPEAIRQIGLAVTMLEEKDVASGDLSKFDTIVVGIRASETRPDLVANNGRLLEYAKNGGNVIVQYQRGNWTALAPFPVTVADTQRTAAGSIARVVDENAKVNILEPAHPVFNTPNKITDADFSGWVQERNAYNLVTFDAQFTPLLESHDAGEAENKGGLVVAQLGKGTWTYCSYSFFRQLPNGVSGAYRLFANLLSLPKAQKPKATK